MPGDTRVHCLVTVVLLLLEVFIWLGDCPFRNLLLPEQRLLRAAFNQGTGSTDQSGVLDAGMGAIVGSPLGHAAAGALSGDQSRSVTETRRVAETTRAESTQAKSTFTTGK